MNIFQMSSLVTSYEHIYDELLGYYFPSPNNHMNGYLMACQVNVMSTFVITILTLKHLINVKTIMMFCSVSFMSYLIITLRTHKLLVQVNRQYFKDNLEVVFNFENVVLIFEVIFIFRVLFISEVIFIFEAVFIFEVVFILKAQIP